MNSFITKYIKEDKNDFIIGRQVSNLTRGLISIINVIQKQKVKEGINSLD